MPAAPEPSDEEIKDAIWIVLNAPSQGQMGMPPPSVVAKLTEHLANGGSALVMTYPNADTLEAALSPWGVKLDEDFIAVKTLVANNSGREGDQIEQAERKYQHVFILKQFGDHVLTKPLQSLEAALVPVVPIEITKKDGYTATPIVPIPQTPASWAVPIEEYRKGDEVKFDKARDKAPPIYGGAVVEKNGGARLVVIGSLDFANDQLVLMPDEELYKQGYRDIPRFPGNAELFTNSVFWLAKMEPMIAISPSANQISRIAPMTDSAARMWNVGVLLVGLPGLVIVAGVMMYLSRRD